MSVIVAAALWCLAAPEFFEQNVPGLRVQGPDPLTGTASGNFRTADLNGDGAQDLLLPGRVFFQSDGIFPPDEGEALPRAGDGPYCDVFGGAVYYRFERQLAIYRWQGSYWQTEVIHPLAWPEAGEGDAAGVQFSRFLYDLDGDDVPEILAPSEDGVHLYRRSAGRYEKTQTFSVWPARNVVSAPRTALGPASVRTYAAPIAQLRCTLLVESEALRVLTRRQHSADKVRYVEHTYPLSIGEGGQLSLVAPPEVYETPALPKFFQPCRLNADGVIDYAGGDWSLTEAALFPTPVYQTAASLDGGETIQRVRTEGFRPRVSFVDMDDDGDADLVAERTGLLEGGIRESASRFLTRKTINHEIRVYHQDARGEFSQVPDLRARLAVRLDAVPFKRGAFFRRYRAGDLVDVTGDYNGDGYRDVAALVRPDELAVFLSTGSRVEGRPAKTFPVPAGARFAVTDLNGDGRSDLIVSWRGEDEERGQVTHAFLSREESP